MFSIAYAGMSGDVGDVRVMTTDSTSMLIGGLFDVLLVVFL